MSVDYSGVAPNVSANSAMNIVSTTNTNPITVTISGTLPASWYSAGLGGAPASPLVTIVGHETNTVANGTWEATLTGSSNSFTIPVAGIAAGGATGVANPLDLQPLYQVPSDGQADNQASITSWTKAMGDRSQFLASKIGTTKIAGRCIVVPSTSFNSPSIGAGGTAWASWPGSFTSGINAATFGGIPASSPMVAKLSMGCLSAVGLTFPIGIDGFQSGDFCRMHITLNTINAENTNGAILFPLFQAATSASTPSFATMLAGGTQAYEMIALLGDGSASTLGLPISVTGWLSITTTGTLWMWPALYYIPASGTIALTLINNCLFEFECHRPTTLLQ